MDMKYPWGTPVASSLKIISSIPIMVFMGVRISWDMFARKRDFALLALSASSLACLICSYCCLMTVPAITRHTIRPAVPATSTAISILKMRSSESLGFFSMGMIISLSTSPVASVSILIWSL